jgi:hypothetical protein
MVHPHFPFSVLQSPFSVLIATLLFRINLNPPYYITVYNTPVPLAGIAHLPDLTLCLEETAVRALNYAMINPVDFPFPVRTGISDAMLQAANMS